MYVPQHLRYFTLSKYTPSSSFRTQGWSRLKWTTYIRKQKNQPQRNWEFLENTKHTSNRNLNRNYIYYEWFHFFSHWFYRKKMLTHRCSFVWYTNSANGEAVWMSKKTELYFPSLAFSFWTCALTTFSLDLFNSFPGMFMNCFFVIKSYVHTPVTCTFSATLT